MTPGVVLFIIASGGGSERGVLYDGAYHRIGRKIRLYFEFNFEID